MPFIPRTGIQLYQIQIGKICSFTKIMLQILGSPRSLFFLHRAILPIAIYGITKIVPVTEIATDFNRKLDFGELEMRPSEHQFSRSRGNIPFTISENFLYKLVYTKKI